MAITAQPGVMPGNDRKATYQEPVSGETVWFKIGLPSRYHIWWMHWTWLYVSLVVAVATDRRHDYWSYIEQWRLVLAGQNPWSPLPPQFGINTYGPVQNLLAVFLPIDRLAPKLVIIGIFGIAASFLLKRLLAQRYDGRTLTLYLLAVPGNMLITSFGFTFGSNDVLAGAFIIFAILARLDGRILLTAFWLTLGILLKFYPVLFVPLFMIRDDHKIDFRLAIYVALLLIGGMALSYVAWGIAVLDPFRMAATRGASFLSIFAVIERAGDNELVAPISGALIKYNSVLVLFVAAVTALWTWLTGRLWLVCAAIVVLAALLTYKVGHQQLMIPWCATIACLPLLHTRSADRVAMAAIPLMLFLSIFSLVHVLYDPIIFGEDNARIWPFLAFPFGMVSLVLMIRRSSPDDLTA